MNGTRTTPDADDLVTILEYLDGRLTDEAMMDFELRLANDPQLGAVFEQMADMDHLQRAAGALRQPQRGFRLLGVGASIWVPLAAALLVAAVGTWLLLPRAPVVRASLLVCGNTPQLNNLLLELDPGVVPGIFGHRGPNSEVVPDDVYWGLAGPAQDARYQSALASPPPEGEAPPLRAGHFVLPFRPEADCSVLVLALAADARRPTVLFPVGEPWSAGDNRFVAGALHVLPRPNLMRSDDANGITWDAGFLVPLGVDELRVLAGFTAQPFDENLRRALDAELGALASLDSDALEGRLRRWLEQRDFTVHAFRVVEE